MKRVLTAVVLIPLVLAAVLRAPDWLFISLVGIVALLATREYLDLAEKHGLKPFRSATLLTTALFFLAWIWFVVWSEAQEPEARLERATLIAFLAVVAFPWVLLLAGMVRRDLSVFWPSSALSAFALAYIAIPLGCVALLRGADLGWFRVLLLFIVVWVGDIAAYYVGTYFGRHLLVPAISPKKTWEGTVASFVAGVAATFLLIAIGNRLAAFLALHGLVAHTLTRIENPAFWVPLLLGGGINIAAQLGDLIESAMKRGAGVKDSGQLLPGHGGVLDRIDALLFAAPVAVVLFGLIGDKFIIWIPNF